MWKVFFSLAILSFAVLSPLAASRTSEIYSHLKDTSRFALWAETNGREDAFVYIMTEKESNELRIGFKDFRSNVTVELVGPQDVKQRLSENLRSVCEEFPHRRAYESSSWVSRFPKLFEFVKALVILTWDSHTVDSRMYAIYPSFEVPALVLHLKNQTGLNYRGSAVITSQWRKIPGVVEINDEVDYTKNIVRDWRKIVNELSIQSPDYFAFGNRGLAFSYEQDNTVQYVSPSGEIMILNHSPSKSIESRKWLQQIGVNVYAETTSEFIVNLTSGDNRSSLIRSEYYQDPQLRIQYFKID